MTSFTPALLLCPACVMAQPRSCILCHGIAWCIPSLQPCSTLHPNPAIPLRPVPPSLHNTSYAILATLLHAVPHPHSPTVSCTSPLQPHSTLHPIHTTLHPPLPFHSILHPIHACCVQSQSSPCTLHAIPAIPQHHTPPACNPMTPHTPSLHPISATPMQPTLQLHHPIAVCTPSLKSHFVLYPIPITPLHPAHPDHHPARVPSTHPMHSGSAPGTRSRRPAAAAHGDRRRQAGSGGWPCRQCPPAGPRRSGDTACHRQRPPDRQHTLQGAAVCRGDGRGVDTDIAVRGP